MANPKFIIACFFLIMLIFCQEIQSSEGRPFLGMKREFSELETDYVKIIGKETTKSGEHNANKSLPTAPPTPAVAESQTSPSGHVHDFRPTTPGHSPGVGHSLQN